MKLDGSVDIKADPDKIWAFLTDPDQMGGCLPHVQEIRKLDDGRFEAHAKVGLGYISAKFVMLCEFTELEAPNHATLRAHGTAPGSSVDGTARFVLRDVASGVTSVDWTADVTLTGVIARFAGKRIEGAATNTIAQTLRCVRANLRA